MNDILFTAMISSSYYRHSKHILANSFPQYPAQEVYKFFDNNIKKVMEKVRECA